MSPHRDGLQTKSFSIKRARVERRTRGSSDVSCPGVVLITGALMRWIFSPAIQIGGPALHRDECSARCCDAVGHGAGGDAAQRVDVAYDDAPAGGHEP